MKKRKQGNDIRGFFGQAAASRGPSLAVEWSCSICTFLNDASSASDQTPSCAMCNTPNATSSFTLSASSDKGCTSSANPNPGSLLSMASDLLAAPGSAAALNFRPPALAPVVVLRLPTVIVGRQFHAGLPPRPADAARRAVWLAWRAVREPANEYDSNALLVQAAWTQRRDDHAPAAGSDEDADEDATEEEPWTAVGHLPSRVAKLLSPLMDAGLVSSVAFERPPPLEQRRPLAAAGSGGGRDSEDDEADDDADGSAPLPVDALVKFETADPARWQSFPGRSSALRPSDAARPALPPRSAAQAAPSSSSGPRFQTAAALLSTAGLNWRPLDLPPFKNSAAAATAVAGGVGALNASGGDGADAPWAFGALRSELERQAKASVASRNRSAQQAAAKKHRNRFTQRSLLLGFGAAPPKSANNGGGSGSSGGVDWGGLCEPLLCHALSAPGFGVADVLLTVR
jgi:hypothetical protein